MWFLWTVLSAFGALCMAWAVFGFLLPGRRAGALVCLCRDSHDAGCAIARYRWLWGLGLLACPLVLVDQGLSEEDLIWLEAQGVRVCTMEELAVRLEQEREEL